MKKLIYILAPTLLFAACTKDISRFNEETKKPANVPAATLFSNGVRNLSDALASGSVNTNVFRFTVKHWAMAVYQDEAQFDFSTRNIPQAWWTTMYRDVLADLNESAKVVNADGQLEAGEKANKLAIIDLMEVYTYNILVNTFGDVPYTEALNPNILFPKYDDAKTIYADLLKRLDADIANLNPSKAGFAASEDLIYGKFIIAGNGNLTLTIPKWIKFANSLKMKMGMIIADVDAATAKTTVEAADAGAMSSSADDAKVTYLGATPNTNPLYADIVLGGRGDYVAAEDLMNVLDALNDPRKDNFFGTNNAGE